MRRSALTFAGLLILVAGAALAHAGPGRHTTPFIADEVVEIGVVDVWNNGQNDGSKMMVQIELADDWLISEVQIYIGYDGVPTNKGNPKLGHFPFKHEYENPVSTHHLTIDLEDDLGFLWGQPYQDLRTPMVAVHADVVILDELGEVVREEGAWAYGPNTFEGSQWGWWLTYRLAHPRQGHFIDSPVFGLNYDSPTHSGSTGEPGGFSFFPDEEIDFSVGSFYLGTTPAARKVSPVDFWIGAETEDPRVIDVARVLQTLDFDQTDGKIVIDPAVAICFNIEAENLGVTRDDFGGPDFGTSDDPVEALLVATVEACNGINGAELAVVSAADAKGNLEAGLNASGIFRKNVSKTEDWAETKQKLDVMPVYLPGLRSNGDPSMCVDVDGDGIYTEGVDTPGVPYEEWRLDGDPMGELLLQLCIRSD